jgi:hypothetical protein
MTLEDPTSEKKEKLLVPGERVYANIFVKNQTENISIFGSIDQGVQTILNINVG